MTATVGFPGPKNSSQHTYTGLEFGIGHLLNYRIPPGLSDLSILGERGKNNNNKKKVNKYNIK